MKQCCKCNKEVITGFVICGDCVKKENHAQMNEIEKAIEILERMRDTLARNYRYQNAEKIDTEHVLDLVIQALKEKLIQDKKQCGNCLHFNQFECDVDDVPDYEIKRLKTDFCSRFRERN